MKLPRFSLRTLFVLVALIGIPMGWVAHQLNWIRQRHAFLEKHEYVNFPGYGTGGTLPLPLGLAALGESKCIYVFAEKNEQKRAAELFPEAIVRSPYKHIRRLD